MHFAHHCCIAALLRLYVHLLCCVCGVTALSLLPARLHPSCRLESSETQVLMYILSWAVQQVKSLRTDFLGNYMYGLLNPIPDGSDGDVATAKRVACLGISL